MMNDGRVDDNDDDFYATVGFSFGGAEMAAHMRIRFKNLSFDYRCKALNHKCSLPAVKNKTQIDCLPYLATSRLLAQYFLFKFEFN